MNDRPQIDPRYDPAFQRGFAGEVQTGQHPHGAVRAAHPPAQAPAPTSQPESVVRRAEPLPTTSVPPAYAVPSTEIEPEDADVVDDEAEAEAAPARPLTRNPFVLVLGLLGAALIVGGTSWAISGRASMTDSGALASERDYWYVQAALLGAPVMIGVGVLIIAGVLFMFAHAWRPRHAS